MINQGKAMRKKMVLLMTFFVGIISAQDSLLLSGVPQWDQIWPYNMYCPIDTSINNPINGRFHGHYPAGCVAVAVAQILRYYRYPENGKGSIQYSTNSGLQLGMKFDTCKFDWDHMPLTITGTSQEIEQKSVAKLISAVGLMFKTSYATKGSSAEGDLFANYVSSMVGYSGNVNWYRKDSFSKNGWDSIIQRDIKSGRPVLYSASSIDDGHAFVIEGYKKQNAGYYYYVNSGVGDPGVWCLPDSISFNSLIYDLDVAIFSPIAPASLPTPQNLKYSFNDTGLYVSWDPVQDARLSYYQVQAWNADETQRGIYKAGAQATRRKIAGYTDTAEIKKIFPEGNDRITVSIVAVNKDSTGSCLAPWITITRKEFISKTVLAAKSKRDFQPGGSLAFHWKKNMLDLTVPYQMGMPCKAALFTLKGVRIAEADVSPAGSGSYKVKFREKEAAPSILLLRVYMADGSVFSRTITGKINQ
jgi:hypothetical protein